MALKDNKVIGFKNGGSVGYKDAVDYKDVMAKSELYVNITASKGNKTLDFEPIKIADGVLATSEMYDSKIACWHGANAIKKYCQNRVYSKKEVEERGWHGPRANFSPEKLLFPERSELLDIKDGLSKSCIWRNHSFLEGGKRL
mgnify:CR=1 FL=1